MKEERVDPWFSQFSQEQLEEQPKQGYFSQVFDNLGAFGKAAYANTRELGMGSDIKDLYDRLRNGDFATEEEGKELEQEFYRLQNERNEYRNMFAENQKILNQNDSALKDFTEVGGTLQGIGTQAKDTLIGAGVGAVGGSVLPGIGTAAGASTGATWGNRVGAIHQAIQDADMNAIDAWERVLQEGGTSEQAEQAYNDALVNNLPTEALDVIGNLYFGSKILGNAVSSNMAQKLSKSALGKTAEKVSRFDLPAVIGTNVAKKFGSTAGKIAGGVTASTLEGIGESIQEPWQDYATERAIDIQRRQYDPNHEGIRDFSVLGDGGLLDYYTTPEGRETAWKSFKMGAAFGGIGSALSASQFTKLGTANNDSIAAGKQLASEFSEGGEFFGTDVNYDDVRKMMGNIYGLTEDERDSLSKEDVYRMYVDYWTNKYTSGGFFSSGNRQEVNAVMQADLVNALTGQETNRADQLNDYSRRYVDKYALNPDNSIFNDIKQQQAEQLNQEEQVQNTVEESEQNNGEETAITARGKEGTFTNETAEEAKERNGGVLGSIKNTVNGVIDKVAKRSEWYDLPDKFGKQWVWADDGMDSEDNRTYRNTETGRLANVQRIKVGKRKGGQNRYIYTIKDITNGRNDPNTVGVGAYGNIGKGQGREFTDVKQVEKYLNLPRANRDTSFMADSQHGNEQGGIKQALPQEDGVIASKDIQKDAEGNEVYNGRIIQSRDAFTVHSMDDLDTYFREHGDLMSTDLYAEVARGMMRFGIGKDNKTSIVLDLANDKSGALGSKTTWMENPNDPNSAIAKAVIRLYAGADLVTAAHEIAHLGWINLSDQDKNTFARWAIDTEEEFVARVLGYQYDNNFRAYLLEALTNQGKGGSLDSQALWQKIKEQGATKQTIDILNNHANDQNIADAIDERFAWEFSNWFAQGYIKGEQPHNVIERILQKACQSMGDALRLLYDTDRYLNDKNYRLGASGRDVADIFNRISASRKDRGQQAVIPQQGEPVSLRTEMRQPIQEAPYNLGQGFDEAEYTTLDANPTQNLGRNTGTITGTSPVATTPITQEEDPEPKKKRSKEHKEWEKRQQEKKEAQERAIKDARDNVKTKLNAVKDLYNKKASVEDLTKAVDGLYGAAMSAKDLSTEKEHIDLVNDAFKKAAQFGQKIEELKKRTQQTTRPISNVGSYHPVQGETLAEYQERVKREQEEQQRIKEEREKQNKQKMDKMKKDIETKAKKINQSLNAKNTKFSIDELGKQIDELETLLQAYDDEHLAQLERGDGDSFYDKKFVDDQEKLIKLLRTKLREKEEESKNREYKEKLSQSKQNIKKLVSEADKLLKEDILANKGKIEEILSDLHDELMIYSSIPKETKEDKDFFNDAYQKQIDIGNTLREKEEEEQRKKEEEKRNKEEGKRQKELDSMDTTNEYGNDVEEQKEWYKNKITTKDRKKIQSVNSDGYAKGLTLYGKLVYANALEKFGKSRSTQVNSLAKQNALLFARMCERIAKIRNDEEIEARVESTEGYNAKTIADEIMVRANAGWNNSLYGSFTHREYEKNMFHSRLIDRVFGRTINLFEITTPSTFIHEATHWYQLELEIVAEQNPKGQAAKDLKALYDWAEYKGKEEETKRADEMSSGEKKIYLKYINAIENARNQAGKEAALETWRDEKIARATEEYMREGNSPIEKLKDVFERFKQWITSFYHDTKPLTSELSPNVKKALDRMILTDDELKQKYGKSVQNKNASATNQTSPSDTKMQESSKEEIAKNRKPTVWSISATGGKTAIRRSKYGVGKDVSGQIYFHKDYAEDVIPSEDLKKARDIAHREGFTEDKYNCMMYDTHTGVIRFDEAPDFDTHREPITGKYLRVYPDGRTEASKGGANQERQIWHHKWLWVKEDYKGFDVQASREWSEKWLEANKGQGRPSGKKSEWDKKLRDIGLGKYIEDTKMQVESVEGLEQNGSSAGTSNKQIAAMFKKIDWKKGTVNADIGGGKYDLMTEYVKEKGVENIVFDPGNRTLEHNRWAVDKIQHRVDTVTVANVLNVLPSERDMKNVILQAAECLKPNGKAYFLMYEGDKSGNLKEVKKGQWQQNKKRDWYRKLLEERFGKDNVKFKYGFYTCTNPIIKEGEKGVWSLDDTFKDNNVTLTYDNADTKFQVASKNAQNQTRLNAKSEQVLEKLFRRLVRDKKMVKTDWNKNNIDRLKKYTNVADRGTNIWDMLLNPNDKRTMDGEYLKAVQKINDYLHKKYPYLKNIWRGADGHWRFEFSDKDAKLAEGLGDKEQITTLGKVLKHDNLYKFYPKLKNMKVHIVSSEKMSRIMGDPSSEYDGAYDARSKDISLNIDSFKNEDMRKVLLHEIQHAIQDIEGLASGQSAYNEERYEASAGEKEAVATEKRANMSDEELQNKPRKINPKEKTILSDVRAITDTKMQEKSTPITRTQLLQDLANLTRGSAIELNAITVHDEMSKQYMREQMAERGFTEKEAEDLIKDLEKIADEVVEIAKDHPYMQSWQNRGEVIHNEDGTVKEIIPNRVEDKDGKLGWLPVRNAFRSNGEYKVNMDLGTLCMKREAFDALMQIAVKEGFGKNLGISQIEGLKEVLKKYKYATACDVCYVETRRARMLQYANNVSYDWDSVLMALDLDDGNKLGSIKREFDGIIEKDGVKYTQQQVLDMMTSTEEDENGVKEYVKAFNMFVPDDRKRVKKNPKDNKSPDLDTGTTADKMYKIAKLFKEDSTLAGWFNPDLLLTSSIENGTGYLACNYGGHTNIISTLGGLDSQNTPKPIESFIVYDPLSWKDANGLNENQLMRMLGAKEVEVTKEDGTKEIKTVVDVERATESLYDIGGGRLQAFSDFNPILFLDYCQLIADYAARRMPIHAYTKVPALVELFGETRMMINMSLLPEIVDGVDADHLGLKKNPKTGEWEYAWHKDSFPPELAFEYRKRKQYEGHVGIIAIGISKEHILKMMADPEIDMIIPYHKSGMAKGVQIKTLLERATDYTKTQTMKYPKYPKDQGGKSREAEIKAKIKEDTGINGDVYLNYSRILFTFGDPQKAAEEYVRRCKEYGCTPAFEEFAYKDGNKKAGIINKGYYKLLEDFRGYDNNGNPVLQEAARFKLPDNWNEILKKQLSAREKMIKYKESMTQNEALLRDMRKVFTPQRIDGEIKERMITALRKIFKYDSSVSREQKNKIKEIYPSSWRDKYSNVRCLPQQAFLNELEKEYQKTMSAEEAAKAVEIYRRRDGIVYGFSRGKSIFLNEDYMNANTPAHEFTHIWAKIAQAVNPTLWKEGVGLLQQHEKKLWKEVQNDPLYANIKNNDDAIASEVLARLTGRENERFIAEVLDPKKKLNKLDKLTQQIKDWCTRMFTKVRSLFDTNNTKPLTLGEFVRMPLKAIWENQEQSKFTKGVSAQFKNKKFKEQNSGMQSREQNFDAINSLNDKDQYVWNGDQSDTKMQEKSTPKTYPDQNKDVYSVTFTKSAQRVGENQKKMAFYRKNDSYWRENKNKDGSITFTRKLPYKHHQRTLVYDDINGLTVGKKKKTKFREYYEAVKDQLIKWWFNDKHFLYKAAKNAGALNSYMRMMVMKDQGAVASAAIEDGIVKHNSKKGERTKSLNSIIEAVGEANQTDFLNYCEAFRIIDLYKRGIRQKMDVDLAHKEIEKVKKGKNAKLFEQQRQYFVEYNHELLWVLVDGGFITEEQYNKFIEVDPNFIPLSKNMEELEDYVGGIGVSKKMINAEHPIYKIGTSMREVKNPFLEMQRRTVEYYVKASRNKAGRIFVNDIAEAIARGANGSVVAINQGMVRKLKSRDQNGNPISMDGKQNIFYVWNEGEKEYYQVADREIYEALRSFDSEQMSALKKIVDQTLGRTSRLVRNTATMTPDFGLRNLCRDNVEAFISSEHGFLPFIDAFWGMYQMANDTQWFREYQQMNGEPFNTLNRDGEDVATVEHDVKDNIKIWKTYFPLIKKDFREFTDKNRSVSARAKSLLLLGTDVIGLHSLYKMNKKLNDYMEVGTRIGEYRNARMGYHGLYGRLFEGKVKGNRIFTNDKDLVYATNDELFSAYKSKDITLNFGQHGTIGKELNRIIPFFNASLQGIYKIGNTIDNMVHGDDNRIREELLFKCILMGAMGMAAALAGQGDDDYEEAPEYEHDSFWILPNGIRIPKDQLFGRLIGGTVEKATRQYLRDGDVKKLELVQDVLGNFVIDKCVPALVDIGWGTVGNYDSFRKKSVTPEYMADKIGYLQKDLSTSKAAVDIAEIMHKTLYRTFGIDVGAKKIDFVISKTLSNLGKYAVNLYELTGDNQKMTRGAEPEDRGGFAEWSKELPYPMNTIVGTFATNRNSFQSISDFYERYRELKKLSSDESIMSKAEKKAWDAYQKAYKEDKKYRDALKAIKQDKSLTGAQKRQKADKIFKQQISMARKLHDWEKKHGLA